MDDRNIENRKDGRQKGGKKDSERRDENYVGKERGEED